MLNRGFRSARLPLAGQLETTRCGIPRLDRAARQEACWPSPTRASRSPGTSTLRRPVASDGATLLRCPVTGTGDAVCHIDTPITATYTAFDGVNESDPAELTLRLDSPATPPISPSGNVVVNGTSTAVVVSPASFPNIMIPAYTNLSATLTPTSTPNVVSMSLTYPTSCVNPSIPASCTYATAEVDAP